MSVDSYLSNLANEMIIRDSEKESINTSYRTLEQRINRYFGNEVIEVIKFGSYTRGTILPRKFDSNSDIDVMIVFKNPVNYNPQTYLNYLKKFAEKNYYSSEIYQSHPTIVLELNHIKFELIPAKLELWQKYSIPKNTTEWMLTEPNSFNDTLIEANKNNLSKIKPIVRLVKYWNIQNGKNLNSFELERKIADNMRNSVYGIISYTDYLKKALDTIENLQIRIQVKESIEKVNEALSLEREGYPYLAKSKIEEIFKGN